MRRGVIFSLILLAMGLGAIWALSYSIDFGAYIEFRRHFIAIEPEAGTVVVQWRFQSPSGPPYSEAFSFDGYHWPTGYFSHPGSWKFKNSRLGVGWERLLGAGTTGAIGWCVGIPYAYLVALALLIPAIAAKGVIRQWRRKGRGRCIQCGYDLRSTPERCPECGRVAAAVKRGDPKARHVWRWLGVRPFSLAVAVVASLVVLIIGVNYTRRFSDAIAFHIRAMYGSKDSWIIFVKPPNAASLRHLARMAGKQHISFFCAFFRGEEAHFFERTDLINDSRDFTLDPASFRGIELSNVESIAFQTDISADGWLREFTRPDSGLKNLKSIHFASGNITYSGLEALARPDTGLKCLEALSLEHEILTIEGINVMTRSDTGLKNLAKLAVPGLFFTDLVATKLARPGSGLKKLRQLYLLDCRVSAAGLRELARPDTSLASLNELELIGWRPEANTDPLEALARPDGGLKSLRSLRLNHAHVTDAGLLVLARPDSGLRALEKLDVTGNHVTPAGLAALRKARPSLGVSVSSWVYDPPKKN